MSDFTKEVRTKINDYGSCLTMEADLLYACDVIDRQAAENERLKKPKCICGGDLIIQTAELGNHKGECRIVCVRRLGNDKIHLESVDWFPNEKNEHLIQALKGN